MSGLSLVLGLTLTAQIPKADPGLAPNSLYRSLRTEGLTFEGLKVDLPAPTFPDGLDATQERARLAKLVEGQGTVDDLIEAFDAAPEILNVNDVKTKGGVAHVADLYYVVHAPLSAVDPTKTLGSSQEGENVEAAGMKFTSLTLKADDLAARKVTSVKTAGTTEAYVFQTGEMLGEVGIQSTSHIVATQGPESVLAAFRTDPRFDADPKRANLWHPLKQTDGGFVAGKDQTYEGGGGYTKLTRLKSVKDALIVEAHFAFYEPNGVVRGPADPQLEGPDRRQEPDPRVPPPAQEATARRPARRTTVD